ncbi:MAG: hypothetical protein EXX96DRAFT_619190 [Benjaminiella poitrasii]|nr:MAG: hypothetical protein EXX96DRAFT_619190 [Benjaminiella poitrasii]
MPLIIFGDGLKNRSQICFRGHRHGASESIDKHLKDQGKRKEVLLMDINEFRTSKVCHSCLS